MYMPPRRKTRRKKLAEDPRYQAVPETVVREALYSYVVQRQQEYPADLEKWRSHRKAEGQDMDIKRFTETEDVLGMIKLSRRPHPMDLCLINGLPHERERLASVVAV